MSNNGDRDSRFNDFNVNYAPRLCSPNDNSTNIPHTNSNRASSYQLQESTQNRIVNRAPLFPHSSNDDFRRERNVNFKSQTGSLYLPAFPPPTFPPPPTLPLPPRLAPPPAFPVLQASSPLRFPPPSFSQPPPSMQHSRRENFGSRECGSSYFSKTSHLVSNVESPNKQPSNASRQLIGSSNLQQAATLLGSSNNVQYNLPSNHSFYENQTNQSVLLTNTSEFFNNSNNEPNILSPNEPSHHVVQGRANAFSSHNISDFSRPPPNFSCLNAPKVSDSSNSILYKRNNEPFVSKVQCENVSIVSENQNWLERWEKDLEIDGSSRRHSNVKISDFQNSLLKWSSLLTQFAAIHSVLKTSTLPVENQRTLSKRIEILKEEIRDASSIVNQQKGLSHIIKKCRSKRLRKRLSRKRKLIRQREIKKKWKEKEKEIDDWRNRLIKEEKDKIESANLSKEADSVLSEVRSKILEANQMSCLLENLSNLRAARVKKGADHGYSTTPKQDEYFENLSTKLQLTVKNQLEEYKLEEQTLKIMLNHAQSGSKLSSEKEEKSSKVQSAEAIIERRKIELRKILFGMENDVYEDGLRSREELIQRRSTWDQFLVPTSGHGSSIPLSWVVPPTSPSKDWEKYKYT